MQDDDAMRRKLADIGVRFLARSRDEIATLEASLRQLQNDTVANLKQIEIISHRIRGSGAVFGFESISEAAARIEVLALQAINHGNTDAAQLTVQLSPAIAKLSAEYARIDASPPKQE